MIRQYLVLLCILLILSGNVFAQDKDKDENEKEKKEKSDFQRRLFFGGYFWISFGTITQVELAPQVGYHISDRIAAGIGGKYMYYHNRFFSRMTFQVISLAEMLLPVMYLSKT